LDAVHPIRAGRIASSTGIPRDHLSNRYRCDQGGGARAIEDPIFKFEFIRMPNSTGFGDYTESGQVIPVSLNK
jgi:acetoacetate decarboxylase